MPDCSVVALVMSFGNWIDWRYFIEEDVFMEKNVSPWYTHEQYNAVCGIFVKIIDINEGEGFATVLLQDSHNTLWVPF